MSTTHYYWGFPNAPVPVLSNAFFGAPAITSFTASAPVGTAVTITGINFTGATSVTFNGTAASFTVMVTNPMTINTTVPAGATTGTIVVTTPVGTVTSTSSFTVTAPTAVNTTPTILAVTPTNLAYNSRNLANNGGVQYDALSEFTILTNSPDLTINFYGFNETGSMFGFGDVTVDDIPFTVPATFPGNTNGTGQAASYALTGMPGNGFRNVKFTMGGQANYQGIKPYNSYVSITSVVVPTGFSGQIVTPTIHPNEFIYVFGDSTTQNHGAYSWTRLLNKNWRPNSDIFVTGASAMVGGVFISDTTKRAALLADYKATRNQGAYTKGKFWFDSMVNDCYFNSYTPDALKAFYIAFGQLFLGDLSLSSDTLYFKSAITTTAHSNSGPNNLGYPLFAYRDAMSAAVNMLNSPRVRYADGTVLQDPIYLFDGTHVIPAGEVHIAETINIFLNQTATTTVGTAPDLTSIAVDQAGTYVRVSTNSVQNVEYSMEITSGSNTFSSWQTSTDFDTPTAGPRIFQARLQANISIVVATTKIINKTLFANSVELSKVGSWINGDMGTTPTRQAYSLTDGDFYTFSDVFTGFIVYQNRQENCPEILVSIDGGVGVTTNISGPGYNYTPQRVYTVTGLINGTHTVRVDSGLSTTMNIYAIELLGNPNSPPTTGGVGAAFTISAVQRAIVTSAVNAVGASSRVLQVTSTSSDVLEYSLDNTTWQSSSMLSLEALGFTAPLQSYYARRASSTATVVSAQIQLMPFYKPSDSSGYYFEGSAGNGWLRSPPTNTDAFAGAANSDNNTEAAVISLAQGERAEVWSRQQLNIALMEVVAFGATRVSFNTGGYTYNSSIGIIYTSAPAPAGGGVIKLYKSQDQPAGIISYFRRLASTAAVTTTPAANTQVSAISPGLTKSVGWTVNGNIMYGSGAISYGFTLPAGVTGFRIKDTYQSNTTGFNVSIDGGVAEFVDTRNGPNDTVVYEVYRKIGLTGGSHLVTITNSSAGDGINMYGVELFDVTTPASTSTTAPSPTPTPAPTPAPTTNTKLNAISAALTRSTGWTVSGTAMYGGGAIYYGFTLPAGVTGFRIKGTYQSNTPGINVVVDGGAADFVATNNTNMGTGLMELYRKTGITGGTHIVSVTNSGPTAADGINFYEVEFFDATTPAVGVGV